MNSANFVANWIPYAGILIAAVICIIILVSVRDEMRILWPFTILVITTATEVVILMNMDWSKPFQEEMYMGVGATWIVIVFFWLYHLPDDISSLGREISLSLNSSVIIMTLLHSIIMVFSFLPEGIKTISINLPTLN